MHPCENDIGKFLIYQNIYLELTFKLSKNNNKCSSIIRLAGEEKWPVLVQLQLDNLDEGFENYVF